MREFLDTMWFWGHLNEGWSTFATMLIVAVLLWGGYQLFRVLRGKNPGGVSNFLVSWPWCLYL